MLTIRFHGHACFGLDLPDGSSLCIDPFEPGGFGGLLPGRPIPDRYTRVVCTHEHADHNATHAIPSARRIAQQHREEGLLIETFTAPHDEYGGRLRTGLVSLLRIEAGGATIVHLSDLGERPQGPLLRWLRERPIDLLIGPVGGYFTLDADGFAEIVALVKPRFALGCHSAEDGARFPDLDDLSLLNARIGPAAVGTSLSVGDDAVWALDGAPIPESQQLLRLTIAR